MRSRKSWGTGWWSVPLWLSSLVAGSSTSPSLSPSRYPQRTTKVSIPMVGTPPHSDYSVVSVVSFVIETSFKAAICDRSPRVFSNLSPSIQNHTQNKFAIGQTKINYPLSFSTKGRIKYPLKLIDFICFWQVCPPGSLVLQLITLKKWMRNLSPIFCCLCYLKIADVKPGRLNDNLYRLV